MRTKPSIESGIEAIYPLSPMQEGLLYESLCSKSGEYFQQMSNTLKGDVDIQAMKVAWERVIERRQALRTLFLWKRRQQPVQVVLKQVDLPWEEYDWRRVPPEEQQERLRAFRLADLNLGFDLSKAPLMRLRLFHLADDLYEFIWSHHHIILDGWSGTIVINEVYAFYEALTGGVDLRLAQPRPYQDYIGWLRRQDLSKAEEFWREYLDGFREPITVGANRPSGDGALHPKMYEMYGASLSTEVTRSLQILARQNRLTLNTLMQGIWSLILSHHSGKNDIVFGAVVSGRPPELEGVESMVGVFINTLPVRMKVEPKASLWSWLQHYQDQQAIRQQFEYTPLVEAQKWSQAPRGQPLFESVLVFQNYPQETPLHNHKKSFEVINPRAAIRNSYPLTFRVIPGGGLQTQILFDNRRLDSQTILRMLKMVQTLTEKISERPQVDLEECLAWIVESERSHQSAEAKKFKELCQQGIKRFRRSPVA
jgi:hypothetical protein